MNKFLRILTSFLLLFNLKVFDTNAQTTHGFSTVPTFIDYPGVPSWKQIAEVTIDGVVYQISNGGNDTWVYLSTGGNNNSTSLSYAPSSTMPVTIKRKDGLRFKFYGVWLKYTNSSSGYSAPWLTVAYTGSALSNEVYGANTTTFLQNKNISVTDVTLTFSGLSGLNLDDLTVGPDDTDPCTAPVITGNPPNRSICNGGNTTFTSSATGATAYQWQVNTGAGFTDISNGGVYSNATTNTLTITGATATMSGYQYRCKAMNGSSSCFSNSNNATLSISNMTASTAKNDVLCYGNATGSAAVSPTGGIGSYTYSWSPSGGTSSIATGLTAGTYTCTITDAINCQIQKSFTINQPASALDATITKTDVSCNGASNGTATVVPTGGTSGYTYSWAPSGGTAATASGLAVGTYTCTITDANNCQITRSITITQPTALNTTAGSKTDVSCNGGSNGTATVSPTGGTPGYTYSWAPRGGTAATATGLSVGTYTVTVTDANGCTGTKSFTITQPTALNTTAGSKTDVSCNGGSNGTATVSPTGGTPSYTYSWAPSGGTAATATGLSAGTYTVTVTDANGCTGTKTFTITQPTALNTTAGSKTDVSCNGGSNGTATVSPTGGTPGYTYSWAPRGGTAATATGLSAGTYTVTVTDANGCMGTKSFTITQPTALNTTAGSKTDVSCNGGSNGTATVSPTGGTPGYTYSWAPSGGTAATATGLSAGTYTVTVTDANGCTGTKTFTITQPTALNTTAGSKTDVSCNGASNGTATVSPTGGTPGYTYSWAPSGGTAATATGLSAGTYTVTVTDANGCIGTKSFTITQPTALNTTAGSKTDVSCNGGSNGSATVYPTGGTPGYTYSWAPSGGTAATATGLSAGTYTVTVTDANGCIGTKTFTITQPTALDATISKTDVSNNGGSNGTATVTPSGGTGLYTYSWSPLGGTGATATGLSEGNYTVTITDQNLCSITKTIFIDAPPAAPANLTVAAGHQQNELNWGANIENDLVGYKVYGGTTSNATVLLQTVIPPLTTYTHSGLDNGTTYYYRITAVDQADNESTYSTEVTAVPKASQIINFNAFTNKTYGDADFDAGATTTSGLTISYNSDNPAVATIVAGKIHIVGAGTANITASQAGNDFYKAAADEVQVLTVSKKALTVTATANNKIYDGNANAIVTLSDNRVTDDVLTLAHTMATFDNKNVGTNKAVSVSGISISGTDAGNYTFNTTTSTTAIITEKSLTITATATDKVYDGNANATVSLSDDRVNGDVLTLSNTTATFDNKNVGTNKAVSVSGISISGTDAGNYTFNSTASTTASITEKSLTISATATDKVYDGNTNATVSLGDNRVTGDILTLAHTTATFDNKNVGTNKAVSISGISISGADAGNYTFNSTASTTASITEKSLTISATATDKVYDGNTNATVSLGDNRVTGDILTLSNTTATFDNKNVGTNKAVSISGISISGADAANYTFNSTASTTASITEKSLTITATATDKVYDGNTNATVSLSDNRVTDDVLTLAHTNATFNNKNVGTNKAVSVSGISISGADAGNYTFNSTASATASITEKSLTITATATDKVYDGNTNATVSLSDNRVTGDVLTLAHTNAAFNNKNVGTNKAVSVSGISVTGADAINYTFNTTASATASITAKALTVTATANNKIYDGNTNATVSLSDNRVSGDVLTLAHTTATFNNKNIGNNKPVSISGISISGADAANYTFNTEASTTANITAKALTISATATDKVYDGNTNATVSLSDNRVTGDVLTLANTAATFDNKNVGANKAVSVSGISISGSDAVNYTFNNTAATTANVTPAKLSYVASPVTKVYGDANPLLTGTVTGFVTGDTQANATTGTLSFSTAASNASGIGSYAITGSGLSAQNYTLEQAAGNAAALTVTARPVTIKADAKAKIYGDNDPALTYQITTGNLVNGDTFTGALQRDNGQNAGSYAIKQGTVALSNNYNLSYQPANLVINKALLTVAANNSSRCYGTNNPAFSVSYSGFKYSDNENSLTSRPTVSTMANTGSVAGNYELVPSGGVSANYDFSYVKGTLTVNPLPINTIVSDKGTSISKGETAVLTVSSNNGTSYSWTTANGIISGQNSAVLTVRPMETTTYTVLVRNANGCESISTITLEVKEDYIAVEAENFITPNGDGVNDNWVIKNIDAYPNHTLTIVDRSGKIIYKVRNYQNEWNGTLNGLPLAPGTYFYTIHFDDNQPQRKMTRGFITIVSNK
ncbi:Fibronectin type III domain protein [Pseudopedobacter saltans DSM 12145]|uniref:Fibronectin type III domain protein n=1 Tax=Pseudopedobacter saltans (strain ATCC 51119 / DSM 12145 / JCM 21818 / CCUG 39354 / LMG 10337 / NBRC 100064 / NCIMB 13643) TaxID=762903 RepID=F0SE46_PSESL|nr:YDG domain-containing protein [Pseudopedobacter saltans]ADY52972.1 Fibronectin type III domain protein [Pseudopedobacter saltans DSM 12145]